MIRFFDVVFSLLGLIVGAPILFVLVLAGLFDTGSPFFRQVRVGRHQRPFTLVKFRTMALDTESVATHMVSCTSVTRFGGLLRKTKLDELPQLWNVLKGDMSLVGPRPGLFSQVELTTERAKRNVFDVRPGVTGLAQVNGIDMSRPALLAETDQMMIENFSLTSYLKYITMTVVGKGAGDRIVKRD